MQYNNNNNIDIYFALNFLHSSTSHEFLHNEKRRLSQNPDEIITIVHIILRMVKKRLLERA